MTTSNKVINGNLVVSGIAGASGNIVTHDATGKLLDSGVTIAEISGGSSGNYLSLQEVTLVPGITGNEVNILDGPSGYSTINFGTTFDLTGGHIIHTPDYGGTLLIATPGALNISSPTTVSLDSGTTGISLVDGNPVSTSSGYRDTNLAGQDGKILTVDSTGKIISSGIDAAEPNYVLRTGDTMTGNLALSGASIDFDIAAPNPSYQQGRVFYDNAEAALSYYTDISGVTVNLGQEHLIKVKNVNGSALNDGDVVYVFGADGNNVTVKKAYSSSAITSRATIGVVTQACADNASTYITRLGTVHGLDTSAFEEGDTLYLTIDGADPGKMINYVPPAPNRTVRVGYCTKKSAGNGKILVDIHDGLSLTEVNDVWVTSATNKDLLSYNTVNSRWENLNVVAATSGALDSRYALSSSIPTSATFLTDYDARYVNVTGDTMTGNLVISTTTSQAALSNFQTITTPKLQVIGAGTANDSAIALARFDTTAADAPTITLAHSKNATIGSFTAGAQNDSLGAIYGQGVDISAGGFYRSSAITFVQDTSSPDVGIVPGRISFSTVPNVTGGALTEAVRINSSQQLQVLASADSPTLPSYTFIGDADTGMFQYTTNVVGFTTSGQTRLTTQADNTVLWSMNDSAPHNLQIRRSKGNETTPTSASNGLALGYISFVGYYDDGVNSGWDQTARISAYTRQDWNTNTGHASSLEFVTTPYDSSSLTTRMIIHPNGTVLFGNMSSEANDISGFDTITTPAVQIIGTTIANQSSLGLARFDSTPATDSSTIQFARSLSGTRGTFVATTNGTRLGAVYAQGVDTSAADFSNSSAILFIQDGAAGANIVPGRIELQTANSAGTLVTGLTLDSTSKLTAAGSISLATSACNLIMNTNSSVCISADNNFGWDDITSEIHVKGSGANNPNWTLYRDGLYGWEFNAALMNEVWSTYHIPHTYCPNTGIHFHVHFSPNNTSTGVVRWGFEYSYAKRDGTFGATSTIYKEYNVATNSQYKHFVAETDTPVLSGGLIEPDALIMVRIFRDAANINDTFAGTVHVPMADVHFQKSRFATKNKDPDFYI